RERRREVVGRTAGALDGLAFVVDVLDLVLGRDRRGLCFREAEAARIREVAERNQVERVAARADLAIDLEAALQLRLVVLAERARKGPGLPRRRWRSSLLRGGRQSGNRDTGGEREGDESARHGHGRGPAHA